MIFQNKILANVLAGKLDKAITVGDTVLSYEKPIDLYKIQEKNSVVDIFCAATNIKEDYSEKLSLRKTDVNGEYIFPMDLSELLDEQKETNDSFANGISREFNIFKDLYLNRAPIKKMAFVYAHGEEDFRADDEPYWRYLGNHEKQQNSINCLITYLNQQKYPIIFLCVCNPGDFFVASTSALIVYVKGIFSLHNLHNSLLELRIQLPNKDYFSINTDQEAYNIDQRTIDFAIEKLKESKGIEEFIDRYTERPKEEVKEK